MTIGQRIKEARKAAGFTQRELAERAKVATGTIQQYELGKRQPRIEQLRRIAYAIGVDIFCLLSDEQRDVYARGYEDGEAGAMFIKTVIATSPRVREYLYSYSAAEGLLVNMFSELNDDGQKKAIERVEELTEIPKYQRAPPDQDGQATAPPSDGPETPPEDK